MKRFEVTYKRRLNDNMVWLKIYAPLVARKARPGQFIILRTDEFGERIPLTMAGHNEKDGTIDLIYAAVGRTTMLMDQLEVGDCFADIVGPLGKPTHMDGLKSVCVVGGGTGNALAYPLASGMHDHGVRTTMIEGFKNKDLVILEDEFVASLTAYMIDGTGMCGGCRCMIGGEDKFVCVDGPEFDGSLVDWDDLLKRSNYYKDQEAEDRAHVCRLTGGVRYHD